MAVGTVSGVDPADNWQLIATNTVSAVTTSTFSSISGYKKLMMVWKLPTMAGSQNIYFTVNNDTTSKNYSGGSIFDAVYCNLNDSFFWLNHFTGTHHRGYVIIDGVDKSVPQTITGAGMNTGYITGNWLGFAPITSIEFKSGAAMTGTIYLYGIAA